MRIVAAVKWYEMEYVSQEKAAGFEYSSGDNRHFLSVEEICTVNHLAGF